MIYKSADFFIARFAALPFSKKIYNDYSGDLFAFYQKTPHFREAVAIASPTLFQYLESIENLDRSSKKGKSAYFSLLKYLIRSVSRCTPFGLFSCVGWGNFGEKTDLTLPTSSLKKQVRPDMEWIKSLVDTFEKDLEAVRTLKVMINPNAYRNADRFYLAKKGEKDNQKDIGSIKITSVTEQIFSLAKHPILYKDLEEKLCESFSSVKRETVTGYLWGFFEKGFFVTELLPCIDEPFDFGAFVKKLRPELSEIHSSILHFENQNIGDGIDELQKVFAKLETEKKVKYPLQVDTFSHSTLSLNAHMKEELEEAVSLLMQLACTKKNNDTLSKYQNTFLEKYGTNRLVTLKEVIDEINGIGLPPKKERGVPEEGGPQQLLFSSIFSKQKEIKLDDLFPKKELLKVEALQSLPLSIEIFFDIMAKSAEEIDKGNYTIALNPLVGADQAGCTFGRFLYGFDQKKRTSLREFLKKEEELAQDFAFVEASFFPENARTANVCLFEKQRKYQLQFHYKEHNSSSVDFDDIYVGSTLDHLYFYSKKLEKKLIFTMSSAVNRDLAPELLQFLLDASNANFSHFYLFLLNQQGNMEYTPRIRYGRVILNPRRWQIDLKRLGVKKEDKREKIEKSLRDHIEKISLPTYFYLTHFDHRLLLKWQIEDHFHLLVEALLKHEKVTLLECLSHEKRPVKGDKGSHFCEFALPFVKEEKYAPKKDLNLIPEVTKMEHINRVLIPGGDWIYLKLFVSSNQEKQFLTKHVSNFISPLLQEQLINQWFYIRYREDKHHIRLRLQGDPKILSEKVLPFMHTWAKELLLKRVLGEFSLHPYEREVERYGGPELIEPAESLFFADSSYCLHLFQLLQGKELPQHILGAFGILNILSSFELELEEVLEILTPQKEHLSSLTGSRDENKTIFQYADSLFSGKDTTDETQSAISHCFTHFSAPFANFSKNLKTKNLKSWNNKQHIIDSVLHMHCNRLMGIDRQLEIKSRVMAYHNLKKLSYARRS